MSTFAVCVCGKSTGLWCAERVFAPNADDRVIEDALNKLSNTVDNKGNVYWAVIRIKPAEEVKDAVGNFMRYLKSRGVKAIA